MQFLKTVFLAKGLYSWVLVSLSSVIIQVTGVVSDWSFSNLGWSSSGSREHCIFRWRSVDSDHWPLCGFISEFSGNISRVCIFVDTRCAENIWGIPGRKHCGSSKKNESIWTAAIKSIHHIRKIQKGEGKRSQVSYFTEKICLVACLVLPKRLTEWCDGVLICL